MSIIGERPRFIPLLLGTGYALGLVGWGWDWLEHLGTLRLGFGAAPAHYLMYLGAILVLMMLILAWLPTTEYRLAYIWLMGSVILAFIQPLIGSLALLALPIRAVWVRWRDGSLDLWSALALAGIVLVLSGIAVDWFWHTANPGVTEESMNMLLLPGHQLQLAGWLVGAVGASVMLWQVYGKPRPQANRMY